MVVGWVGVSLTFSFWTVGFSVINISGGLLSNCIGLW